MMIVKVQSVPALPRPVLWGRGPPWDALIQTRKGTAASIKQRRLLFKEGQCL